MSTLWQPITWVIFHSITKDYDERYREHYVSFFESFKTIIPCRICRNHFIDNTSKNNLTIQENINQELIFNWTVNLHNSVNKLNYKKEWSHEQARNYYNSHGLNNNILKIFILEYIKSNFKKNPEKTQALFSMLRSLAYLHPEEEKKKKLIDFKERFELNHDTVRSWLLAFLIILKS